VVARTQPVRGNVTIRFFYISVFLIFKVLSNPAVSIEQFARFNIVFFYYIFFDHRVRFYRARQFYYY